MATTTTIEGATLAGYLGVKEDPAPNGDYTLTGGPEAGTGPLLVYIFPESSGTTGTAFTFYCNGARFAAGSTIVWGGADKPTTLQGANTVSTDIDPVTLAPGTVEVYVRNADAQVSETFYFEVTAPAGRKA